MPGLFSQTAEYALRATVWLASHRAGPHTAEAIAEGVDVSPGYLGKVFQSLVRAGIVRAQRGRRGGFELTKPAEDVTLFAVINAVEPIQRIHRCPLGLTHPRGHLCPLHKQLDEAIATVEKALGSVTLKNVTPKNGLVICDQRQGEQTEQQEESRT